MPLARDRRRPRCAPLAATALVLLGASLAACSAPMRDDADLDGMTSRPAVPLEPAPGFARADADGLSIDGVRFTVASANAFDLLQFYAVGDAAGGRAKVQAAGAAGLRMLRVFVTGLADPATARFAPIELWRRDREAFLAAFDAMLADAADAGVHVIPSLITGVLDPTELPSAFGCEDWMSLPLMAGSRNRAAAFDLARDLATRFADDPRVLAWELGNELNYLAAHRKPGVLCASRREIRELVDELSFQIRTIDRHHPIAGGVVQEDAPDRLPIGELPGAFDDVADWFRFYQGVANVDIASTHLYGERTYRDVAGEPLPMSAVLEHLHAVARSMGKPLWLGELGPRPGRTWVDTPYDDDVMSMLLARHHLDLDLVSPWTWQTAYLAPTVYGGQIAFDLDTGHSDAALAVLTVLDARPGLPRSQRWTAIAGDLDGDGRWEVGCVSDGGLVQVAPTGAAGPGAPSQWLSRPAGSPPDAALDAATPLVGDFDGDGRHDLALRTRDGRWLVARSTGRRLGALEPWLSGLGDESSDEGLARSQAIAGGLRPRRARRRRARRARRQAVGRVERRRGVRGASARVERVRRRARRRDVRGSDGARGRLRRRRRGRPRARRPDGRRRVRERSRWPRVLAPTRPRPGGHRRGGGRRPRRRRTQRPRAAHRGRRGAPRALVGRPLRADARPLVRGRRRSSGRDVDGRARVGGPRRSDRRARERRPRVDRVARRVAAAPRGLAALSDALPSHATGSVPGSADGSPASLRSRYSSRTVPPGGIERQAARSTAWPGLIDTRAAL